MSLLNCINLEETSVSRSISDSRMVNSYCALQNIGAMNSLSIKAKKVAYLIHIQPD